MPQILIVEDETSIALMYRFKLEQSGFRVACAYNGVEGLKLAEEFQPDLILLDIRMPEMSGDEMLEHVRATDWGSQMRVVILTNISRDEAPLKLRFLHVDRYIVKAHHTPSQIVTIIEEVLRDRRALK
jgi:DNA-binding response OmpR family regulator